MFKKIKYRIKKIFREFLVYHNSSLEFRAKILTLVVAVNHKISECEEDLLNKIASDIYDQDQERSEILVLTVKEYFDKIITNNGLDYDCLLIQIERDIDKNKRFSKKIDIDSLKPFRECIEVEEDRIYQDRVISFLSYLKSNYD